jgi:hypothetical protein
MDVVKILFFAWVMTFPLCAFADEQSGSQKPLEVNGQSRNLNMMLVLRNDKDKIKFVHPRENYHDEILAESSVQSRSEDQGTTPAPANSLPTSLKEGKN